MVVVYCFVLAGSIVLNIGDRAVVLSGGESYVISETFEMENITPITTITFAPSGYEIRLEGLRTTELTSALENCRQVTPGAY